MKIIFNIIILCLGMGIGWTQQLDERYHSVEEINQYLDSLNQLPELDGWFHLDTIGYSTQENLPILACQISDNAGVKEDEPRVLFVGQVHAEEVLGVEVVMDLIHDLLFPSSSIYTHMNILKQYLDIWIVPTANPEGLNVVHDGLDLSYRKNKRDLSPDGPFPNGEFDYHPSIGNDVDGVDLNRNFSFNWAFGDTFLEPDNSTYASHYDYYKGEEPFSEGEAVALRDIALENDFTFSIVWHSSRSGNLSEKVFTSWLWEETKPSPDLEMMKSIADHFAGLIETEDGSSTYLSVYSGSRNGKLHDWFYRETGCIQYLVECGTANLQPDSALVEDTIDRNKPAMIHLMNRIIGYYTDAAQITGIVYDATNYVPIENAIVEILEHSGSVLKPRKTNEFGRYRRILDVGTYTVSVRAEGYLPTEITTVTNNSGITTEDITLEPAPIHTLTLNLVHDTADINVINGKIKSEFGEEDIEITTGTNTFELPEGDYTISFLSEGTNMPWETSFYINNNLSYTIPYEFGNPITLSQSWPWVQAEGPWIAGNVILKSQEGPLYANGDSLSSIQWMESELIELPDANRTVVSINHRFETEWDHDPVIVSILDSSNNILGEKSWTGDNWGNYQTDLISISSNENISTVKVRLSFSRDETVNYRGWELSELVLYSIQDAYLGATESSGTITPKIPMRINGLFPNPSNGQFQIDLSHFPGGTGSIKVFNLLGQEVFSQQLDKLSVGRHLIPLNLQNLNGHLTSTGVFFVRIESLKQQVVKKCVIIKN